MKKALILICSITIQFSVFAQNKSSYLYLEVNKNLPVEITLNDTPLENQNKGYIIVPKLAVGEHLLVFNFSNPRYVPHTFKFNALGASMGLRLSLVSDDKFVLQDVVNKRIINAEKIISAPPIAIESKNNSKKATETNKKVLDIKENKKENAVATKVVPEKITEEKGKTEKVVETKEQTTKAPLPESSRTYAMYNRQSTNTVQSSKRYKNYNKAKREAKKFARLNAKKEAHKKELLAKELAGKNRKNKGQVKINEKVEYKQTSKIEQSDEGAELKVINEEPSVNTNTKIVKNSANQDAHKTSCTNVVRTERIADWTLRLQKKYDDEARANFIKRKLDNNCISTINLSVLLSNFDTQIGRYKLIKLLYDKIEDPNNTDRFYKYFTSESYIEKIKEFKYEES